MRKQIEKFSGLIQGPVEGVTTEFELVGLHLEPVILGLYKQMFLCALAHMTSTWPSCRPQAAKFTVSFEK